MTNPQKYYRRVKLTQTKNNLNRKKKNQNFVLASYSKNDFTNFLNSVHFDKDIKKKHKTKTFFQQQRKIFFMERKS